MDYRDCKIKYLTNINGWLAHECHFMDELSKMHKSALLKNKVSISNFIQLRTKLQAQLKHHNQQLQYCKIYESINYEKSKDIIEFCRNLKEVYENRMAQLNSRIIVRQNDLQKHQQKIKNTNFQEFKRIQQKNQIQELVQAVQIYPRLIASYKCQNMKLSYVLSMTKTPLIASQSQRFGIDLSEKQHLSELFDGRLPFKQQGQSINKIKIDSTILQQIILCLKKKQYISKKRKQQIKSLREKLNIRYRQNELLKRSINKLQQCKIERLQADSFSLNISMIGKRAFPRLTEDAYVGIRQNLPHQQAWDDLPTFLLES